jgi:hypothetical protein
LNDRDQHEDNQATSYNIKLDTAKLFFTETEGLNSTSGPFVSVEYTSTDNIPNVPAAVNV